VSWEVAREVRYHGEGGRTDDGGLAFGYFVSKLLDQTLVAAPLRYRPCMRYARWSVVALFTFAIVGAGAAIWALRKDDPTGWVQSLLPELIGFLLGSIATYLIIDRVIKN